MKNKTEQGERPQTGVLFYAKNFPRRTRKRVLLGFGKGGLSQNGKSNKTKIQTKR